MTPKPVAVPAPKLSQLLRLAGLRSLDGPLASDHVVTSIADDSRMVRDGACFVAVCGAGFDGHRFVGDAVRAGASCVVIEKPCQLPDHITIVRVADTREALAKLAAAYHGLLGEGATLPRLIGITGTNGKTTTAWMLRGILRAAGEPTALLGTIEYDLVSRRVDAPLTTPGPIALCAHIAEAREAGATYAVLEVSSHALDQRRCAGLRFDAGVFTNFSGDHLDYHGTEDAYFSAKRRLFDALDDRAVALINLDDPRSRDLMRAAEPARVVTYALDAGDAEVSAKIEYSGRDATGIAMRCGSASVEIRLAVVGRHNVYNAIAAAACADSIGIGIDAIRAGLEGLSEVPGRLQRVGVGDQPFSVFVDYAHTDDALDNVLRVLRPLTDGRLICVFGCGGDRDRTKRPRMAAVAERWCDVIHVTSDNPRTEDPDAIIKDIVAGLRRNADARVLVDADRRNAIEAAIRDADRGDVVLIAGKGHETVQLIGGETHAFDDVEVARSCLVRRETTTCDVRDAVRSEEVA